MRDEPPVRAGRVSVIARAEDQMPSTSTVMPTQTMAWIASGVMFVAIPLALTMTMMFAPVMWAMGTRNKN